MSGASSFGHASRTRGRREADIGRAAGGAVGVRGRNDQLHAEAPAIGDDVAELRSSRPTSSARARCRRGRSCRDRHGWLRSECRNSDGVPVELIVAAILRPISPLLPMPVTIRRPDRVLIAETAPRKLWRSGTRSASAKAWSASISISCGAERGEQTRPSKILAADACL